MHDDVTEPEQVDCSDADFSLDDVDNVSKVGDEIAVCGPLDDIFYNGTVHSISDGMYTIICDDGESEKLAMTTDVWKNQNSTNSNSGQL